MPLSNLTFLFYCLPAVIVACFVFSFSRKAQEIVLLAASLLFYALGQTVYIAALVFVIAATWGFGLWIDVRGRKSRLALVLSCAFLAAVLLLFKYAPTGGLRMVLPIGMSLYILQAISYCADVNKGDIAAEKNILNIALYLAFFPKMVAGPIMGYTNFAVALHTRRMNADNAYKGFTRFITGLGKTVILAQPFATLAHHIFIWSAMGRFQMEISVLTAWVGAISLVLQFYFEFSGYSDMAIGLGLMFGITIPENFTQPFAATTVAGCWGRYNRTVIGWFRTYISLPLNKKAANKDVLVRNNLIVWLLVGLWYKAGLGFILFGLWFFLFTLAEEFFGIREKDRVSVFRFLYTQIVMMVGWVMLKTENIYQMGRYLMNLTGLNMNPLFDNTGIVLLRENWLWFLIAVAVLCTPLHKMIENRKTRTTGAGAATVYKVAQAAAVLAVLLFSVLILLQTSVSYHFYL